jgi:hypothetical protein
MTEPAGSRTQDVWAEVPAATAVLPSGSVLRSRRHGTCVPEVFLEKDSHSHQGRVDFPFSRGQAVGEVRVLASACSRRAARSRIAARTAGWIQGASRSGNRKRTRVRVACGGGIRPRGLGRQPIHGHLGLSVVGGDSDSPVVLQPACELRVCQRHFSRGPGLLAALKPGSSSVRPGTWTAACVVEARMAAGDQRIVGATRPDGSIVIRAASLLTCPPERPAAGRGAHPTGQRTRLRNA